MGDGDDVTGELPQHPELLHQLRGLLHHVLRLQAGARQLSRGRQGQTGTRKILFLFNLDDVMAYWL